MLDARSSHWQKQQQREASLLTLPGANGRNDREVPQALLELRFGTLPAMEMEERRPDWCC